MARTSSTTSYSPPWSDAAGWSAQSWYETMQAADVDGDGKAELFGRTSAGIETWGFDAATAQWGPLNSGACDFTDANGWSGAPYFMTIQAADVDGDGQAEIIGRGALGVDTWKFDPAAAQWNRISTQACGFIDANNWNLPQYYMTIQAADVDGDGQAEIIGRGANGIDTWKFDVATTQWTQLDGNACDFTDGYGWSNAVYYMTIQAADVDGDGQAEIIGRGALGVDTWKFDPATSQWNALNTQACGFTDANNWNLPQYYMTIQAADVDGDGQAEIIGRGANGIDTWKFDAATSKWTSLQIGACDFTDANGWDHPRFYRTIQAADLDGDGQAELIGRGRHGLDTWRYETSAGQGQWVVLSTRQGGFSDDAGWIHERYYATLQTADINGDGRAELLGRFTPGVVSDAFNASGASWGPVAPLISVDARLMQNYVLASPVTAGGQVVAVANGAGELELISVGSDGNVYELYPDPASDTGYSQVQVGVAATQIAAGLTDEDLLVVLAGGASGVSYVLAEPAGSASRWAAPQPLTAPSGSVLALAAARAGGHLYVGALAGTSVAFAQWNSGAPSLGAAAALSAPASGLAIATSLDTAGTPTQWVFGPQALWAQTSAGLTQLTPTWPAGDPALKALAAVVDGAGQTELYGVFSDYSLSACPAGTAWNLVITDARPVISVAGVLNAGLIELFAVGEDQSVRRVLPAAATVTDLGVPATSACAAVDGDGNPSVFATDQTTLTRLWQAADTTDWSSTPLEVGAGPLQEIVTYTAELTIRDALGVPRIGEPVSLWPADPAMLTVNGVTAWADAERPVAAAADARGIVTVMCETASLAAPLLQVAPGFLGVGESVVVEPNAGVQARLRTVTAGELLTPTDLFGDALARPLLTGSFDNEDSAQGLAQTVTQSMTLVAPTLGDAPSSRIDLGRVPEQHWRLDLSGGAARFTTLAPDEARAAIATHKAALDAGSWPSIDWGDAWEAVREAAGAVVDQATGVLDLTVSAVKDGISVAVTWTINTVTYAFNGIIEFVEQAFDIVEGVFASVGAAFGQLFEWLGYLFDWDDIVRTSKAFTTLYGQALALLPGALHWLQVAVNDAVESFGSNLAGMIDEVAASVAGRHDLLTLGESEPTPSTSALTYSTANNVILSGLLTNAGNATTTSPSAAPAAVDGPIQALINTFETLSEQFQLNQGFGNALSYFETMAQELPSQPVAALRSGLAGLLEVVNGLAGVVIETAQLIINALLGCLGDLVAAAASTLALDWEIPLVSQLYQYATGSTDPLTPLGLTALLAAVPATVMSKLMTGAAPFADDAALAAFESTFTAETALAALPVAGAGATPLVPASVAAASLRTMYIFNAVLDGHFCVMQAFADGIPLTKVWRPARIVDKVISSVVVALEGLVWFTACPAWALTSPAVLDVVAWGIGPGLMLSADAAWLASTWCISSLYSDNAVVFPFLFAIAGTLFAIVWKCVPGGCGWLRFVSALTGTIPVFFRPLKLTAIEFEMVGPFPVLPWNRVALASIDLVLGGVSGATGFIASWLELDEATAAAAVPA